MLHDKGKNYCEKLITERAVDDHNCITQVTLFLILLYIHAINSNTFPHNDICMYIHTYIRIHIYTLFTFQK